MPLSNLIRPLFAVLLACVITLNSFISPAFASSSSAVESLSNGFWQGVGGVIGAATGTVILCYAVDAVILPFAPPIAVQLAVMCPTVGATLGGTAGFALAKK